MTLKEANRLKKNIEHNNTFIIRKIKVTHNKKNWYLEIHEKRENNQSSSTLSRYEFMITFCKKYQCGMFIEASNNIPNYLLY